MDPSDAWEVALRAEARLELQDAWRWYEERDAGLGDMFLHCVEAVLARLKHNPYTWATAHRQARKAPVRRFPYKVVYVVKGPRVVVIAVMHHSQEPRRWRGRLDDP